MENNDVILYILAKKLVVSSACTDSSGKVQYFAVGRRHIGYIGYVGWGHESECISGYCFPS